MKKILIALTIVISCLGISSVNAADLQLTSTSDLNKFHEMFTDEEFENNINILVNEYKEKYYSTHPYYFINLLYSPYGRRNNAYTNFVFSLYCFDKKPEFVYNVGGEYGSYYNARIYLDSANLLQLNYVSYHEGVIDSSMKDTLILENDGLNSYSNHLFYLFNISENENPHYYEVNHFYYSNFDLVLNTFNNPSDGGSHILKTYDNLLVPTVADPSINQVLSLSSDNLGYHFENLYDYDDNFNTDILPSFYEEINLNDYAYVALALKDYNQEPFSTQVYVKGNYCLTPVYNYGMTEKKDILTGSQTQRCSPYYGTYTPVRTHILENDLKNHSIYYLKAYDTSKDNYIKVDNSIFNITYITEENKDNPYVTIDNKNYPTIPYDDLTDTSTKSEDEGYNAGTSCAVGDFNCMTNNGGSSSFSDIFTAPLEFLKDVWTSITSVFSLITELLSLLPPVMQNFLYASFMLAVVIGLIKIIL